MRRGTRPSALLPATFMVLDEQGQVWPPGFVAQLTNPHHPNSLLRTSLQQRVMKANGIARAQAAETGEGWSSGYMGVLSDRSPKIELKTAAQLRMRRGGR